MKRFKKVLALVLAGVLALAMLTACDGTTDPDKVIPDADTANVVDTVNHMAADSKEGLGQVYYSAKYSEITKKLLVNWLNYVTTTNPITTEQYWNNYRAIMAEAGGAKVMVGMTNESIPESIPKQKNPARKSSFEYDSLFADTSKYGLADTIGVAFYKTSDGTEYQAVCLFKTK